MNHEPRTTNHGLISCPVVILCGGLGLRLRPAIQDKPKCLAPIGGRPFLEWLLANLRNQGVRNVIVCLGYGSDQVLEFIHARGSGQMEIRHVIEEQALGTAGGLRNAAPLIQEKQFLAMNGDTMLEVDLKELLRSHTQRNALASVALWRNPEGAARYGGVEVDGEGRIVRFSEKGQVFGGPPHPPLCGPPSPPRGRGTGGEGGGEGNVENCVQPSSPVSAGLKAGATEAPFINGGVYAFAREIFDIIPGAPASVSLEKDVFPSIEGQRFYGFPCNGYFLDIGIPEDYQKAQKELPERFMPW